MREWLSGGPRASAEAPPVQTSESFGASLTAWMPGVNRPQLAMPSVARTATSSFMAGRVDTDDDIARACPNMTFKQRLIGFGVCFGVGVLLNILNIGRLAAVLSGRTQSFAILYSAGNIFALAGTFFLAGPRRQCRRMKAEKRWIASLVFIVSMVLTIIVAEAGVRFHGMLLLLGLLVLAQWCAFAWYTLSYIPFGRRLVARAFRRCFSRCMDEA
mmetsp:Transcript_21244/g.41566  ORF Transcript_21244/g.41566 Transcript_21244/m.41566 type:complete len:215 (-) Transcript_21244:78-722(-)